MNITNRAMKVIAIAATLGLSANPSHGQAVIFVDDDATPSGDGTSWNTAYAFLQDALAVATDGDEVRVAAGLYKPDSDEAGAVSPGNRLASFWLQSSLTIKGGYRGCPGADCSGGEPDLRDIHLYVTVLSGDLNGDDGDDFASNQDNSYNVIKITGTGVAPVLDGLTITAGNADGSIHDSGGGLHNDGSSPVIQDCTFSRNSASDHGGGVYSVQGSPTVHGCLFLGNRTRHGGGGMYMEGGSPTLQACTFLGNWAALGGGAYTVQTDTAIFTNCVFSGNVADAFGGAVFNSILGEPTLINCTIVGNEAATTGGVYSFSAAHTVITNCILWGNFDSSGADEAAQVQGGDASIVTHSGIEGLDKFRNNTNFDMDPHFVNAPGVDGVFGTLDDDAHLMTGSPYVNAGNNAAEGLFALDIDGDQRIQRCRVDVGADETSGFSDCNGNGVSDACDIANGASEDCSANRIPDECEPDCNGNAIADSCDILDGTSEDCSKNGIPDECDILNDGDCDGNAIPDTCDLTGGGTVTGFATGVAVPEDIVASAGDYPPGFFVPDANVLEIRHISTVGSESTTFTNLGATTIGAVLTPDEFGGLGNRLFATEWFASESIVWIRPDGSAVPFATVNANTPSGLVYIPAFVGGPLSGKLLVVAEDGMNGGVDGSIHAVDAQGISAAIVSSAAAPLFTPALSPESFGKHAWQVFVGDAGSGRLYTLDLQVGTLELFGVVPLTGDEFGLRQLAFSPPGWATALNVDVQNESVLAVAVSGSRFGGLGGRIVLLDQRGRVLAEMTEGPDGLAFDPRGMLFAEDALLISDTGQSDILSATLSDFHQIDCNDNGLSDLCDIQSGVSSDSDGNNVPDECELPGDIDRDRDVDLTDYSRFALCVAGPGITSPINLGCPLQDFAAADLDRDEDVDIADFAAFQASLGP